MNGNEIELITVSYEKSKKELAAFRNSNRSDGRDLGYFDWRYARRPSGREPIIVWAIEKSGETVGSLSVIPHDYSVNGTSALFGVLGDISVSEKARGKGIAGRMLGHLNGLCDLEGLRGCIVLPNEEASRPLQKAHWKTKSCLERHIKFLDIEDKLRRKAGPLASFAAPPVNLLLRLSGGALAGVPAAYKSDVSETFDERFDELWSRLSKNGIIAGRRDRTWLTWRYAEHPVEKFSVFLLSEGTRPSGYVVYKTEDRVVKVYDLLCPGGGKEAGYLLAAFSSHARAISAASIIIRGSRGALEGFNLKKFGFMKRSDTQSLMVRAAQSDGPEWSNWHLTAGDKDV